MLASSRSRRTGFRIFFNLGYLASNVALLFSLVLTFSVFGNIRFGWISDWINVLLLPAGCYALGALGVSSLILADAPWEPFFYVLFGLMFGATAAFAALFIGRSFGVKVFEVICGFFQNIVCLSSYFGQIGMGYIYDATHNYQQGIVYIPIGLLIAAGGMLRVYYEPAESIS